MSNCELTEKDMKTNIKKLLLLLTIALGIEAANAQHTYSGYFLDGYTYRYEMNPAFGNKNNFVAMPGLGNINIAMRGNLHVTDVLYNVNGRTSLFTNPNVGTSEAMSKFSDRNRLGVNSKINIISVGFKGIGGYNTVTISANVNEDASLPKSFFQLAKEGISNKTYDIKNLDNYAEAYAAIALNHSHDIKEVEGLRVGATVKALIGIAALDLKMNEADLTLGKDGWIARTNADIYASIGGFSYDTKLYTPEGPNGGAPREYVSGGKIENFGINGVGFGVDLGAEYEWKDFKFSAAVLDLGLMAWGHTRWASTDGTQTINTDAYTFSANGDADNSFKNEFKNLKDDASKLYQLKDMGELDSRTRALATTLNFGVDYTLPYYRNLHFGLLSSTRINGRYTWTQVRLSANVAPVKIFSANVNLEAGTYGVGFGWMLNLHPKGFNLFLGMDRTPGKLAKQGVPLNSNANFNLGINFPF